jgi:hypothetical protein
LTETHLFVVRRFSAVSDISLEATAKDGAEAPYYKRFVLQTAPNERSPFRNTPQKDTESVDYFPAELFVLADEEGTDRLVLQSRFAFKLEASNTNDVCDGKFVVDVDAA